MDDLSGLDWSSSSSTNKNNASIPTFSRPSLKPTSPPLSGRSTPLSLSAQASGRAGSTVPSKTTTPANDSFSNLLSRNNPGKQNANLTMQERQRQLLEEKARQEEERRKELNSHYGATDPAFWDSMGSGKSTPDPTSSGFAKPQASGSNLSATINKPFAALSAQRMTGANTGSESDLLAAFNSDAPVDSSTHFPAQPSDSRSGTPAHALGNGIATATAPNSSFDLPDDDDDPFGLGSLPKKQSAAPAPPAPTEDDDDVLGLLGKPVTQRPPQQPAQERRSPLPAESDSPLPQEALDPKDKAVAELVDMGFPAEKAAVALASTESGVDVQAAVGLLLNAAHDEAKQKSRGNAPERRPSPRLEQEQERSRRPRQEEEGTVPAWMRNERSQSGQRLRDTQSPAAEKDVAQYASEIGSTFLKSANSLWKTTNKKVQKAVAEFNQDVPPDPSQPKWMRDAMASEREPSGSVRRQKQPDNVTNEAMLLEGDSGRPKKLTRQAQRENGFRDGPQHMPPPKKEHFPEDLPPRPSPRPRSPPRTRPPSAPAASVPSSRGFKFDDDAATTAYTSSARRRTPATSNAPSRNESPVQKANGNPFQSQMKAKSPAPRSQPSTPAAPSKPKAPPRQIPPVSSSALAASSRHRQAGSEAFKRGDYGAAHTSYSTALSSLGAPNHPVTIVILCNRAATSLKNGDPKAAVADSDTALTIIGPGLGTDEKIATGAAGEEKEMKEFYGKALMRKAEALEALEKWSDAASVWRLAVEAGVGGSVSIQGRNRCDKAAGNGGGSAAQSRTSTPRPSSTRPTPVPTRPKPQGTPIRPTLPINTAKSAEAVKQLRAANAAAEKADDEKFALSDSVDAKLTEWKGSKTDNLRALLGSLDKVLWPEAGWKKVGMGELVMPNKCKVVYMKAIAKVHPDKIPQDATTEQKMISAAVFSTLNEAWEKFKNENGL